MGNFVQRVTTQLNHIRHLLRTIFDVVSTHQIPTKGELTRDAFGLHTTIVVLTTSGKVIYRLAFNIMFLIVRTIITEFFLSKTTILAIWN